MIQRTAIPSGGTECASGGALYMKKYLFIDVCIKQSPVTAIQPRHPLLKEGFRKPAASFGKEVPSDSEAKDCTCSYY